ncbi:hypothetical protein [Allokutzneria sp. NRRL B-24872]|uniref:hypothetical protein n=1 Tax=Allokutzneria sp. NRRL B-24872 TaxID=1137961 RepID=UPI001177BD27|nr:hypothetical protein [Allokutzneria sp. NRRL B-24872]
MVTIAAATYVFSDRLVTFLAILLTVMIGLLMTGEPRTDGVSRGRIAVAIAVPLLVVAAAVLLPSGGVGLLWF